jgi:hypothetical protein
MPDHYGCEDGPGRPIGNLPGQIFVEPNVDLVVRYSFDGEIAFNPH